MSSQNAELAKAYAELAKAEEQATLIESQLKSLEDKLDSLLANHNEEAGSSLLVNHLSTEDAKRTMSPAPASDPPARREEA